jgi:hypothetical protein
VQVQTASGSAGAEMTIEGLREFEEIRDYLYGKMRGARHHDDGAEAIPGAHRPAALAAGASAAGSAELAELTETLKAVAVELRALRGEVAGRRGEAEAPTHV